MKKDENSGVSIKQIIITTIFLTITTFGGLNAYRIVCDEDVKTIQNVQSANLDSSIKEFETALVENTEDDIVYSEKTKYLAVKIIDDEVEKNISESVVEDKNNSKFSEKIVSRGNYTREQITEKTTTNLEENTNQNKLLNAVINEIKSLGEKQNAIVENEPSINSELKENIEDVVINDDTNKDVSENRVEEEDNETDTIVENDAASTITVESETIIDNKLLTPPTEYLKTIDVKATAYCLCKKCCGKSPSNPNYGVTASGLRIIPGQEMKVVASDPTVIPLGTNVYIEGLYGAKDYGYAIVADTGSAIKNLKIDLYMDTHQMALNWGVKTVRVYILDK